MADRAQVDQLILGTKAEFGRVDILINNAGILIPGTIEETSDEIIDKTLDINVKGVLYAIRAVTPIMKAQKYGRIVNVASITGKNGDNTTVFAYGASKGAVISLTRSVARQLGPLRGHLQRHRPPRRDDRPDALLGRRQEEGHRLPHPGAPAGHRGGHGPPDVLPGLRPGRATSTARP